MPSEPVVSALFRTWLGLFRSRRHSSSTAGRQDPNWNFLLWALTFCCGIHTPALFALITQHPHKLCSRASLTFNTTTPKHHPKPPFWHHNREQPKEEAEENKREIKNAKAYRRKIRSLSPKEEGKKMYYKRVIPHNREFRTAFVYGIRE